jgi:hypothetical protein
MYLVEDNRHGISYLVFTWEDPKKAGYVGRVVDGVTLDYDMDAVHCWPEGSEAPEACVGRAPDNPNHFKVFRHDKERQSAGYESVEGTAVVFGSWKDYVKLHLVPPDPEQTDDEQWYDYLDKLDEDARHRRLHAPPPAPPKSTAPEDVAAWVAKQHFVSDGSVREVWYLPQGAPPKEIRLLELNDLLAGPSSQTEAIDFGLEVEGAQFRLMIADITSEQLEEIKRDPSRLPPGWSLEESRIWRRGA